MGTGIRTRIVKIGNSQGIRITKLLLDQIELGEEVKLEMQEGQIVIRPIQSPRHSWDEWFAKMAQHGDDRLLDAEAVNLTNWDTELTRRITDDEQLL